MDDSVTRACRKDNPSIIFDELGLTPKQCIDIIKYNFDKRPNGGCYVTGDPADGDNSILRESCYGLSCACCKFSDDVHDREGAIKWLQSASKPKSKTISSPTRDKYFPKLTEL